jgi:hypothetical protein
MEWLYDPETNAKADGAYLRTLKSAPFVTPVVRRRLITSAGVLLG